MFELYDQFDHPIPTESTKTDEDGVAANAAEDTTKDNAPRTQTVATAVTRGRKTTRYRSSRAARTRGEYIARSTVDAEQSLRRRIYSEPAFRNPNAPLGGGWLSLSGDTSREADSLVP